MIPATYSVIVLRGNVYLNPVTEEATLRARLGVHSLEVARKVLPWFVEKYRANLRPDEARLLELWGRGESFRTLLDLFEDAERFIVKS